MLYSEKVQALRPPRGCLQWPKCAILENNMLFSDRHLGELLGPPKHDTYAWWKQISPKKLYKSIFWQQFKILGIFVGLCMISSFCLNFCATNKVHLYRPWSCHPQVASCDSPVELWHSHSINASAKAPHENFIDVAPPLPAWAHIIIIPHTGNMDHFV